MKLLSKIPVLLLFFLGCAGPPLTPRNADADFIDTLEFGLHGGYRLDQFDWNIAGNLAGQNPNVLSELDWKDLKIWQIGVTGKLAVGNDTADYLTYIRGSLDYGWITDGTVRDSDYHGNNRTLEFSRSLNAAEDDDVLDGSIGLGFEKKYWQNRCTLGWLGGYSYHEQNLRLTDGVQLFPAYSPIIGLDSTFESKWFGPFAGIDLELRPFQQFSLLGSIEYHWVNFEGRANWNLRTDFAHPVSFKHQADEADGIVGTLRGRYSFSSGWMIDLTFNYRDFSAEDGINQTFLADGTTSTSKLNEVNWKSYSTSVGVSYRF
jgi:hypothetical protein